MVPLGLFVVLTVTSPDYLPVLVEDPRGIKMIIASIVSASIGIYWIRRILRIEV
jgi:tight adherence protein B